MATQTIAFDRDRTVLLVVDMQPDFMPGGALPVAEGDLLVKPVWALMNSGKFLHFAGTQDWHPPGHVSFASSHPGHKPLDTIGLYGHDQILWPDHCVQGTPGADIHLGIPAEKFSVIVRKATDPRVDSYSTFRNNWGPGGKRPPTGLTGYLRERGIENVFLCGLARDFCVKWSAEDGVEAGFNVWVIWDLTRSVDPSADQAVSDGLTARGVRIITSELIDG
jgi:nicotinamidase/pyrazinamidase